ncbi:histidine kinase [Crossiella sp. SN42]|uniref:sensor histidine kinase n=1 Tax=Crossiella sp. SN42 TaxID=2944808 RepID=UPI00207D5558|nr:histidine kinase [Crossiella sp. SN42]MCO1581421.1 histidine kinase [Crossiella sp. SN42]
MPRLWDLLIAALVLVVIAVYSLLDEPGNRGLDLGGIALLLAGTLALVFRRRFPLTVLAATLATVFPYYWFGYPDGPAILLPTVALFTVAAEAGLPRALLGGAAALAVFAVGEVDRPLATWGWVGLAAGSWLVAVISLGLLLRANRERRAERGLREAEEQRLAIAREVHDVVAHSLAVINVQAGVGAHVAQRRPEEAHKALLAIKEASRSALTDLRATLAVVRGEPDRAPPPSLSRLPELLDSATAAGLSVQVSGEIGELPSAVDAAAFRITQEALTNIVRHAEASSVTIHFEHSDTAFELSVRDDGPHPAQAPPGNGLRGMRERAAALGGALTAGPAEGGWLVRAVLPR